ncbi:Aste57867_11270 [Aphanomyces stellatus]|uniref:Aste57867_11270 protein n=1 Tax=Aphanomyces stellatus TaxID=120398 RepID=A0A485KEF6_9STRA|nr:hypothetical protein As57867_011228 [Aphanomyces stellatus]KAF0707173.1 hypothetical protein As57867_006636 [Aphanomyces stellatus]VFT83629.1 Aste57867_6656 [Aphanomyces stellatus]VFT88133.1 Aste57867_11270 [Aphanomyces stellatus]
MQFVPIAFALVVLALDSLHAQSTTGWFPCNGKTYTEATRAGRMSMSSFFPSLGPIPSGAPPLARTTECAEVTMPRWHLQRRNQRDRDDLGQVPACQQHQPKWLEEVAVVAPRGSRDDMCVVETLMASIYDNSNTTMDKTGNTTTLDSAVDIYTMDHRGTGRSSWLTCSTSVNINMNLGDAGDGSMLAAYSTTRAATDVSKIVSLLDKEKESYVYGVGYGTYLVERVMQLANKQIKGYISWSRKVAAHATKSFRLPTGHVNMNDVGHKSTNMSRLFSTSRPKIDATIETSVLTDLDKDVNGKASECNVFLVQQYGGTPGTALRKLNWCHSPPS